MNTCEKNDHYYYFLFIQRYRTSYSEGTATPPYLSYFCKKKIHFLSFSNILDFLEFFHIFLTIFPNRTATPLRSAATLRIARYVAFWRQAATPAATAIFILAYCPTTIGKTIVRVLSPAQPLLGKP